MNRRNFFGLFAKAAVAFSVLPRVLKPRPKGRFISEFKYAIKPSSHTDVIFHARDYYGEWRFVMEDAVSPTKDLLTVCRFVV